jgi:hypothetical protein
MQAHAAHAAFSPLAFAKRIAATCAQRLGVEIFGLGLGVEHLAEAAAKTEPFHM